MGPNILEVELKKKISVESRSLSNFSPSHLDSPDQQATLDERDDTYLILLKSKQQSGSDL
jgi:hypothetical protein